MLPHVATFGARLPMKVHRGNRGTSATAAAHQRPRRRLPGTRESCDIYIYIYIYICITNTTVVITNTMFLVLQEYNTWGRGALPTLSRVIMCSISIISIIIITIIVVLVLLCVVLVLLVLLVLIISVMIIIITIITSIIIIIIILRPPRSLQRYYYINSVIID